MPSRTKSGDPSQRLVGNTPGRRLISLIDIETLTAARTTFLDVALDTSTSDEAIDLCFPSVGKPYYRGWVRTSMKQTISGNGAARFNRFFVP